jgi:aryl-alcohol dehydrogenase-like predicted oxidoreductase
MEIRKMGRTGLAVTALGIGTGTFGAGSDRDESMAILDLAYQSGIRLIDTADFYPSLPEIAGESERIIGEWIRTRGVREQVIVATKLNSPMSVALNSGGLSRKHIIEGVEGSLSRLSIERIDVLQAHRPDRTTPLEETVEGFDHVVRSGKVHHYGVCNWPVWMVMKACAIADAQGYIRPTVTQYPYSPVMRDVEREGIEALASEGIGLFTINALAGGLLTGRYKPDQTDTSGRFFFKGVGGLGNSLGDAYRRRYWSPAHFDAVERLHAIAAQSGRHPIPTAIAWAMNKPGVTSVLLGASSVAQLQSQLAAAMLQLDAATIEALDEVWWTIPRRFYW